jgi:hypothetical protein
LVEDFNLQSEASIEIRRWHAVLAPDYLLWPKLKLAVQSSEDQVVFDVLCINARLGGPEFRDPMDGKAIRIFQRHMRLRSAPVRCEEARQPGTVPDVRGRP